MAARYAVATGNWSNVSTWDGGTTLPGVGDTVRPNTFTVTIDQNITVTELRNDASAPAAALGSFTLSAGFTINANVTSTSSTSVVNFTANSPSTAAITGTISGNTGGTQSTATVTVSGSGTLTITGPVNGGSGMCALLVNAGGTVNIIGNVLGGAATGGQNPPAVLLSGTGIINVTGTVTGGSGVANMSAGISVTGAATLNVTGNVTGGSNAGQNWGISNSSTGAVNVTGNVSANGSVGIINGSTGVVTVTGNLIPSSSASAVINAAIAAPVTGGRVTVLGNIQSESNGHAGFGNGIFTIDPTITLSHAYRKQSGGSIGAERVLYTGGTNIGQPIAADVRYATVFGASSEFTGSLRVPAAQYVSQGVLVDAGSGTLQPTSPDLLVSTTIATLSSQTSFTLTAGPTDDSALVNSKFVCFNAAGTKSCVGRCSAYTGSTKTVTLAADPGLFTMAIGDTVNFVASDTRLVGVPAVTAGTSGGLPTLDSDLTVGSKLKGILTTLLTESVAGYLAAAFKKLFDVAVPVFTSASVNQTADNNTILASGTFGNNALLTQIQNIQNNTFVSTTIPQMLEKPDSGSVTVSIVYAFADETGTAKNLDSGNPIVSLTNDAGTDLSSRLSSFTNPATGKYVQTYTNSASDTIEGLHWDVTGTVNSKLRRYPAYTQIVDTTAVDFTSADRTNLGLAVSQTTAVAIRGDVGLVAANLDTQIATLATGAALAAVATNATTAATQSTAAASSAATAATQSTNAATSSAAIKLKTDNLPSDPADASVIAAAFAAIPDAVWDALSEDSETMREAVRLCRSGAAGKLSGAGTLNIKMRDAADTKNRIDAVVDTRGNRTAVTVDAS